MYYYFILIGAFALFAGVLLLTHFIFKNKRFIINERIIPFILIAIFAARFYCYNDVQFMSANYSFYANFGGPMSKLGNTIGNLCIWFEITAFLMMAMRPFFNFKTAKWYSKFISTSVFFVCAFAVKPMLLMMQGHTDWSVLTVMLPIEIGASLAYSGYTTFAYWNVKINKHSYLEVGLASFFANFATFPPFIPSFFLGQGDINHHIYDLSIDHRIVLYFALAIIPLGIYFALRNAHKDKIHYALIFISLGTMLNFCCGCKYDDFLKPWSWPFHLCNTAMFVIPFCFIFRTKRVFYFTYFINVFGAILAMTMPDYNEMALAFSPNIVYFWVNHAIAYFMPLLGVALYEFERPKMKQYFYSMIGFAGYYLIVLILNPVFGAYGHETDFFFINSNFIADKLGSWANKLFAMDFHAVVNGKTLVWHPIYQTIYFLVYAVIGFGVWFVYQLGFDISDSHRALNMKLRGIHTDKLALKSALNGRRLDQPMNKDAGVKLELKHLSKRYSLNKFYSVKDANLEVNGGEVFGFLGPNGAGKSTIIKSIVGILPITEGTIEVCGFDCKTQPVCAKSLIGFVPDHYALYEKLTGREYLNYIADIYEVSKEDRDARLSEYISLFELEGSIDNKIKTYSHGMKQKITIISALVHNPKVWILDEPLTGLDPTSIYQVKECMKRHAKAGNIVFFSSHLIDIVEKLCDRIAIIKKGEIQAITTVQEIEKTGSTLEEFYLKAIGDTTVVINK